MTVQGRGEHKSDPRVRFRSHSRLGEIGHFACLWTNYLNPHSSRGLTNDLQRWRRRQCVIKAVSPLYFSYQPSEWMKGTKKFTQLRIVASFLQYSYIISDFCWIGWGGYTTTNYFSHSIPFGYRRFSHSMKTICLLLFIVCLIVAGVVLFLNWIY